MNLKTKQFYEKLTPLKPTVVYLNQHSIRQPQGMEYGQQKLELPKPRQRGQAAQSNQFSRRQRLYKTK